MLDKILVGIPHMGTLPADMVISLLSLQWPCEAEYVFYGSSLVYYAREDIAKQLVEGDYSHLMFIDSDMVLQPDTVIKLMEHNKPIVSARAHKRVKPFDPCFYIGEEPYHNYPYGLIEVDSVGMACCLIKREVFEKIPPSWFMPEGTKGEDMSFCKRAKEHGFTIWVDTTIEAGHIGTAVYGEKQYKAVKQ